MQGQSITGTLLPLFSLYSYFTQEYGVIGNGLPFIQWLKKTEQSAWQMLPLHETHFLKGRVEHAPSPYQSYGIGLHPRFLSSSQKEKKPTEQELAGFTESQKAWLPEYALFCSLRDAFGTDDWRLWNEGYRKREPDSIASFIRDHQKSIAFYSQTQWQLHDAYKELKQKAEQEGVQLIGDIPFYLSVTSPLVWMFQNAFLFNDDYTLPRVSGVVNEKKAVFGRQIWGHPLYNWENPDAHSTIQELWQLRLAYLPTLFHTIRLDHANGFFLYGSIDPANETNDQTLHGPGEPFFLKIIEMVKKGNMHVFAEDAAVELSELRSSMKQNHIPGVRVFRFAFDEHTEVFEKDYLQPSDYPVESVAYTTNHDIEPLMGFIKKLTPFERNLFCEKIQIPYTTEKEFATRLRDAVMHSPSYMHIIPLQDWFLTTDRINTPGTEKEEGDTNWQYRVSLPVEDYPTIFT